MSPVASDDLTEIIEPENGTFAVHISSASAEDGPDYREIGRFSTHEQAQQFLEEMRATGELS